MTNLQPDLLDEIIEGLNLLYPATQKLDRFSVIEGLKYNRLSIRDVGAFQIRNLGIEEITKLEQAFGALKDILNYQINNQKKRYIYFEKISQKFNCITTPDRC